MSKVILSISGMSCSACSNSLEKYLNKQKGIINASVNLVLAQALIEYDNTLTINDLNSFLKKKVYFLYTILKLLLHHLVVLEFY